MKLYTQQYSKKVTHLSQQGYGKKKVQVDDLNYLLWISIERDKKVSQKIVDKASNIL